MPLQKLLRTIALLLTGLYAGAAMYSIMGISPAIKEMSATSYIEFHQKLDLFMGVRMALFAKIALAVNVLLLISTIRSSAKLILLLTIIGFLLFFAELFFTLSVNVPINEKIQSWNINQPPGDWMDVRAKWVKYDSIRAVCALASFITYLAAFGVTANHNKRNAGK
jgi:uncharacterized membrane protein